MEMTLHVRITGLESMAAALTALAGVERAPVGAPSRITRIPPAETEEAAPVDRAVSAAPVSAPSPDTVPVIPTAVVPPAAETAPASPVPVASAPVYTVDQVAAAAANLRMTNPDVLPALMEKLAQAGVKTLPELPPDKLGEFATMLRGMGAKI